MKRFLWLGFGGLVVATLLVSFYLAFSPKIGHATRAQIEAALPASLKVVDPPNPQGVARYEKLASLVRGLDDRDLGDGLGSFRKPADPTARARALQKGRPVVEAVDRLLAEGGIWCPQRSEGTFFRDAPKFKSFAKLLSLATADAAARGDRAACGRDAALNLRYGHALLDGGGVLIDGLVAIAIEAIATRAAYEAEMKDGLGAAGRKSILALLPVDKKPMPHLGAMIRRDFQAMALPVLLEPKKLTPEAVTGFADERPKDTLAGTFDPVATARLMGRVYDAAIADASRPLSAQTRLSSKLAEEAAAGLPQTDSHAEEDLWYRVRMNAGRNTLGRTLAANGGVFDNLAAIGVRRATDRNLLHAVLLLRMGRPAPIPDPYGKGNLRIDPKRRIVWSVGENGKDDGGDIGLEYGAKAPDHGRKY